MGCRGGSFSSAHTWGAALAVACSLAAACEKRPLSERDAGGGPGSWAGAGGRGRHRGRCRRGGRGGRRRRRRRGGWNLRRGHGGSGRWAAASRRSARTGSTTTGTGRSTTTIPSASAATTTTRAASRRGFPATTTPTPVSRTVSSTQLRIRRRQLLLAAQVRSREHAPELSLRRRLRGGASRGCSLSSSQTQICVDRCSKLVPNGCDCFGCCTVPGLPGPVRIWYSCTAADFGNPQKCPPCTQVTQCLNPCERCELCVGKPTLPDDCATSDGGAPYACPAGAIACGTHGIAPRCCPSGTSCVTGCCLPLRSRLSDRHAPRSAHAWPKRGRLSASSVESGRSLTPQARSPQRTLETDMHPTGGRRLDAPYCRGGSWNLALLINSRRLRCKQW